MRDKSSYTGQLEWIGFDRLPQANRGCPSGAGDCGAEADGSSCGRTLEGKRQFTLIQAEHLSIIAGFVDSPEIFPELVRRYLPIRGINHSALENKRLYLGGVLLESTGSCHSCTRMGEALN